MIMDCEKYVGKCVCGREHTLETKKVVVEYDALKNFEQYITSDISQLSSWTSTSHSYSSVAI